MSAPSVVTVSDVMSLVRQEADMVNSQFVADPELISYISASYKELYDLLVGAYGEDYYGATPVTITTDGTNDRYNLPDGTLYSGAPAFYKLLGVDLQLSTGPQGYITLKTFPLSERNKYSTPNFASFWGFTNMRYRLFANQLMLNPLPAAGQNIRLWYVPRPSNLTASTDTLDGISGWEEYVVVDAAIKCKDKEESDCSVLMARKQALKERIESIAANRDPGTAAKTVDVYNDTGWGNDGYGRGSE